MGTATIGQRKQRALKELNLAFKQLEKLPQETWTEHKKIFTGVLTALVAIRWELNQLDKVAKHEDPKRPA